MQLWQCAANANMASCRKCNHGIVPQMQLGQRAANATNGQDRTRVSILLITGKPSRAEPSRAEPSRAEPSLWRGRAEPSLWRGRACGVVEPSRAEPDLWRGRACGVVEPVAWSSLWRGRACGVVEPVAWSSRACGARFQIAGKRAAPNKTQQNFKITYCKRNNLSQNYRGAQFSCA
jgi:hypothetical protein